TERNPERLIAPSATRVSHRRRRQRGSSAGPIETYGVSGPSRTARTATRRLEDMAARLLDGVAIANEIRGEVAPGVAAFTAKAGRRPGLGIVLVGDNPASEVYVRNKLKSAGEAGLLAELFRLPATASLDDLLRLVDQLNRSEKHDGILVQSPLPDAMGDDAERRVFDAVAPDKDVDGFHP